MTVDRTARRAVVRVRALPGAELETYYALERRANERAEDWDVQVIPPAKDLPAISFTDGEIDTAGQTALTLAIWAGQRLSVPVGVTGVDGEAETVIDRLSAAGIDARRVPGTEAGAVTLSWLAPDGGGAD